MASQSRKGCVSPAAGVIPKDDTPAAAAPAPDTLQPEEMDMAARVGHEAPDFEANAYHQGSFTNVRLSNFKGSWIVLCFYPGDFTFV